MTIMSAYRGPSILASHLCLMAASCGWDGGLIPDVVYSGEMPEARLSFEPMSPGVNAYKLLTSIIVPRPIAWISSLSIEGIGNLAPHSFFTVASADPPIVQFTSVGSKDTLRNVIATEEFVINLASVDLADFVNQSSAPYPPNVDEAQELGMITEPSEKVAPMRVSSSPASIECRLHSTVSMGDSTVVFGNVVAISVRADVLDGDRPSMARLRPISRLGGDEWGLPPEVVHFKRPRL